MEHSRTVLAEVDQETRGKFYWVEDVGTLLVREPFAVAARQLNRPRVYPTAKAKESAKWGCVVEI